MTAPVTDTGAGLAPARTPASVAAAARSGLRLEASGVETLLHARGDELAAVMAAAAAMRDEGLAAAGRPGVITYSRKVFIPITTLCRDRCHYCVFVDTPAKLARKHKDAFMSEEQVLAVAHQGAALGCKEALLTLGDRPEDRWDIAQEWLDAHGFATTLEYVGHLARLITRETGLLAHLNPGVMTADELAALRDSAPSMGMMLETSSTRLYTEPGEVHYGSPDKDPAVRLQVLEDAGAARIPFTTGILVGIGETLPERAQSLLDLRDVSERHGGIQETIVQNFRAKPATAMQDAADAEDEEYLAAVAAARLVMGPGARIQAPPNLSSTTMLTALLDAGVDDWGGVSPLTADHVNPERPWPQLDRLAADTAAAGFELRERLTAHPEYIARREEWIDPALWPAVDALATPDGLATTRAASADADGLSSWSSRRRRTWRERASEAAAQDALELAATPDLLGPEALETLLTVTGDDLDRLTRVADGLRRSVVGETASLVVNRNIDSAQFGLEGPHGVLDLAAIAAIAAEAKDDGAEEICIQGTVPPDAPASAYEDIARAVTAAAPGIHLHAFRPADVVDGAARTGRTVAAHLEALAAAGVGTVPGTGVKLLDEAVRAERFPDDLPVPQWIESITAAHRLGLRSTSVVFYGHGETATQRIAHLTRLRALQGEHSGFTEAVPMPVPGRALAPLVEGRSDLDEHRAMYAVARLALHGSIGHVQAAWPRLGIETATALLSAGADDLGGTLLQGRRIRHDAMGAGTTLTVDEARVITRGLGRQLRLRSTTYGAPGSGR